MDVVDHAAVRVAHVVAAIIMAISTPICKIASINRPVSCKCVYHHRTRSISAWVDPVVDQCLCVADTEDQEAVLDRDKARGDKVCKYIKINTIKADETFINELKYF